MAFACLIALTVAAGIVFILYGPIPVRRRIEMISRMGPPLQDPIAGMLAAQPMVQFSAPPLTAPPMTAQPIAMDISPPMPMEMAPPKPPPKPVAAVEPLVAALQLRRPRTENVKALPRARAAKGTQAPPPPQFQRFDARTDEMKTAEAPQFDQEELTIAEDLRMQTPPHQRKPPPLPPRPPRRAR